MPLFGYSGAGTSYGRKDIAEAGQSAIETLEHQLGLGSSRGGFATVVKRYADRNTCDIQTSNGNVMHNVPMLARGGVINGKVWGVLDLPQEDDLVVVAMVGGNESNPIILGTVMAFLHQAFQSSVAVNSENKQFTTKLLEQGKEDNFRWIHSSGVSFEIKDDGTVVMEKPDGSYVHLKSSGFFDAQDAYGNQIESSVTGIEINGHLKIML